MIRGRSYFKLATKQTLGPTGKNGGAKAHKRKAKFVPARPGKYDVVIVDPPWPIEKVDRDVRPDRAPTRSSPSRSHRASPSIASTTSADLSSLQAWDVSVLAVSGPQFDLSTPHGKMIASGMAALAEFERDLIRERIKSGIAAAKARGKRLAANQDSVHRTASVPAKTRLCSVQMVALAVGSTDNAAPEQ
jgi:hypothetical protein